MRRRWASGIAVGVVIVAVVVLGVLFARSITARLASARKIDQATELAKSADTDIVAIDLAVRAPIDETSTETKALAAKRIAKARGDLRRVVVLTDEAYRALNDDEREQAVLIKATAEARLEMLDLAEPILTADGRAAAASGSLTSGWDRLVNAKALSRDAAAQYNKLTKGSVGASTRLLRKVRSQLSSASADFEAAQSEFPSLDTAAYLAYIGTLRQLNSLAIQSNTAWLKGQTAQANVFTTRYNILEKTALEQAKALPVSPSAAIAAAYDEATKQALQDYVAARKKATEADTQLRQL
jgi:hypothetical protein